MNSTWTTEQRQAQEELQGAIEQHIQAFGVAGDGLLVDWALVMQLTGFDEDGDRTTVYHLAFATGQLDDHRAVGLFDYASHLVRFGASTTGQQ